MSIHRVVLVPGDVSAHLAGARLHADRPPAGSAGGIPFQPHETQPACGIRQTGSVEGGLIVADLRLNPEFG